MSTTNSIGTTGRDYSTLQAWEDAVLATPTGGYIGECYNDSEFTAGCTIAGHTTSASDFIRLTAASGQSFQDHANVRTNALYYDQTKGVAVSANPFSAGVVDVQNNFVDVRRLQLKRTGTSYSKSAVEFAASLDNSYIKDCIVWKSYSATDAVVNNRESNCINVVAIETGGGASAGFSFLNTGTNPVLLNCTAVRSSALGASGTGFAASAAYSPSTAINCASFGWTAGFAASGFNAASGYNCTDSASAPGSNNQVSKTFANQFVDTTNDFRLKSGADCIDHGNTDATLAPNDISGTARGVTTAGDIGAWEYASSGTVVVIGGSLEQEGFRWRNDDGGEDVSPGASWAAAQDTNGVSVLLDTAVRLRVIVNAPGLAPTTSKYRLEARRVESPTPAWFEVEAPGSPGGNPLIRIKASAYIPASGADTTAQLISPAGSPKSFVAGRIWDDESGLDDVPIGNDQYTELEFCIEAVSANGALVGDVYEFRVTRKSSA